VVDKMQLLEIKSSECPGEKIVDNEQRTGSCSGRCVVAALPRVVYGRGGPVQTRSVTDASWAA
jgi:hypothetical protein